MSGDPSYSKAAPTVFEEHADTPVNADEDCRESGTPPHRYSCQTHLWLLSSSLNVELPYKSMLLPRDNVK